MPKPLYGDGSEAFAQFQLYVVMPACLVMLAIAAYIYWKAGQIGKQGMPAAGADTAGTGQGDADAIANPQPRTRAEVARHATKDDCWLIIDGKVYDVTSYIDQHPGEDAILNDAGGDASAGFHGEQHPDSVHEMIPQFFVGDLVDGKKDE